VASDFWSISCEYEETDMDGKLFCYFNWDRVRLFDRLACTLLFESCIDGDGMATVTRYNIYIYIYMYVSISTWRNEYF
jgi:hypothetical protein